jgi:hypothetical protein
LEFQARVWADAENRRRRVRLEMLVNDLSDLLRSGLPTEAERVLRELEARVKRPRE